MNLDSQTIEQIVQGVLKQLQQSSRPSVSTGNGTPTTSPVAVDASGTHSLILNERVITGDLLESRISAGTTSVQIGSRAVLTPTAQDFVRKRGLQLSRGSKVRCQSQLPSSLWRILISDARPAVEKSVSELVEKGIATRELVGTTDEAVKGAASMVCRGEVAGVVAVVSQPHRLACQANRYPKVRAAVLQEIGDLGRLQKDLGPNLLCVEPGQRSFFELRNLLRRCVESGKPVTPADWA